jgi:hypothetical protein
LIVPAQTIRDKSGRCGHYARRKGEGRSRRRRFPNRLNDGSAGWREICAGLSGFADIRHKSKPRPFAIGAASHAAAITRTANRTLRFLDSLLLFIKY